MAQDYDVALKVLMAPFLYITEEDRDKPFPNFYERWILGGVAQLPQVRGD